MRLQSLNCVSLQLLHCVSLLAVLPALIKFEDIPFDTSFFQICKLEPNNCCVPVDIIIPETNQRVWFFAQYAYIARGRTTEYLRGHYNVYEYPQKACHGLCAKQYPERLTSIIFRTDEDDGISSVGLSVPSSPPGMVVYPYAIKFENSMYQSINRFTPAGRPIYHKISQDTPGPPVIHGQAYLGASGKPDIVPYDVSLVTNSRHSSEQERN